MALHAFELAFTLHCGCPCWMRFVIGHPPRAIVASGLGVARLMLAETFEEMVAMANIESTRRDALQNIHKAGAGGGYGSRTHDLLNAIQALSQLS